MSLRIVPDQDTDTIVKALWDHLETSFQRLQSPNTLEVRKPSVSPSLSWLSDPNLALDQYQA